MKDNLRSYRIRSFKENCHFPDDLKKCNDNANEDQFVPIEVKKYIRQMAM